MESNTTPEVTVAGTYVPPGSALPESVIGTPQQLVVQVHWEYGTPEEVRDAWVAQFPKNLKITGSTCSGIKHGDEWVTILTASFRQALVPNNTTGERNETGLKRSVKVLDALKAAGVEYAWVTRYTNSYETEADFRAAVEEVSR